MRLYEALKRFNVGLETATQFLAFRGMPLESKELNARIRDFQVSALSREFGYTYSSTPTPPLPKSKKEEKPERKFNIELQFLVDENKKSITRKHRGVWGREALIRRNFN